MAANKDENEFLTEVFPAELEEIKQRRGQLGLEVESLQGPPSTDQNLVGLALSGGGIRSAAFSLGVIQGLSHHGMLKFIDYLSTVSGGGYMGGCLSSLLSDPAYRPEKPKFPLGYQTGAKEPPALTHLRNSSNYLSPGGLLNTMRLPNLLLRGILLNLFAILPLIMAAVFLTEVVYEKGPHWDHLPNLVPPFLLAFAAMAIAFPFMERMMRNKFDWKRRNSYELWLTVPLLLAICVIAVIPFLWITELAIEHSFQQLIEWRQGLTLAEIWPWLIVLVTTIMLFMLAGKASENVSKVSGKLVLLLIGLLGPAIVFGTYLLLSLIQIDSPFLSADYCPVLREKANEPEAVCPADLDNRFHYQGDRKLTYANLEESLVGRNLPHGAGWAVRMSERKSAFDNSTPVWEVTNTPGEPVSYTIERVSPTGMEIVGGGLSLFDGKRDWVFALVFIGLFLFNRFFLDVNITSPHGFYRDRLSKAFLFRVAGDGLNTVPNDTQTLSSLNEEGTSAPYHLINVALNLQGSNDPDLRGRKSDFFFFSKRYTGSERTG